MNVIVDANIVFSAILNSDGKIADILINSGNAFSFIAPNFLRTEIYNHYSKLEKISGLTFEQIREIEYQIYKFITFISEEQIDEKNWQFAVDLVRDIDPKDIVYIAYTKQFNCNLWTGDKKLLNGLAKKEYPHILSTNDLVFIRNNIVYANFAYTQQNS
jgi:predicted nucleic acid-binding protein